MTIEAIREALGTIRIGAQEGSPYARCPDCDEVMWLEFEFEGEIDANTLAMALSQDLAGFYFEHECNPPPQRPHLTLVP